MDNQSKRFDKRRMWPHKDTFVKMLHELLLDPPLELARFIDVI